MKGQVTIRKATVDDAEGKGYVHYQSWVETYTGLFPDEELKHLSLQRSVNMAREYPENTYVAIVDDRIVGFCCYLESRDEDLTDCGEIVAVYILKAFQGLGIGMKLMEKCYEELNNYSTLCLWVLSTNDNALGFYEKEGFTADGKTKTHRQREIMRMIKRV